MTSRERVARTLARQQPDRVPIYDKFWFETERAWREQLGCPYVFQEGRSKFDWGATAPETQKTTLWEVFDMDITEVGRAQKMPWEIGSVSGAWKAGSSVL